MLDPRVLKAEMAMIAAELVSKVEMTDAEHDPGLMITDKDKLV